MAINATVDGVTYEDVNKVTTGGKEIALSYTESGGGDLPQQISEIKYGTYTPTANVYTTTSLTHGCSSTPDIIIMWSNYRTFFSESKKPSNSVICGATYDAPGGLKSFATVASTYTGNEDPNTYYCGGMPNTSDGFISNVGSSTFDILCVSNRRLEKDLTYEWIAIVLA